MLIWQACGAIAALCVAISGVLPGRGFPLAAGLGIPLGVGVGCALFVGLTREWVRSWPISSTPLGAFAARSAYLGVVAASEEVIWRGLALALLASALAWVPALILSSAGFSLVHGPRARGDASIWLLIGAVFGAAFLLGGLGAAIAAHVSYNLSIMAALESERVRDLPPMEVAPSLGQGQIGAAK